MSGMMEDFFSNPWVTGIFGGIISGIIVYFITNFISEKRQNKEYKQKISSANRDVIYLIRTCIPDGNMPDKILIDMLIDSVARKYSVNKIDMLNMNQIYSDISREIMDSYFIATEKKMELCGMVINSMNSNDKMKQCVSDVNKTEKVLVLTKHKQLSKDMKVINFTLSVVSSVFVALVIILPKNNFLKNIPSFDYISIDFIRVIIVMGTAMVAAIITSLTGFLFLKIKEDFKKNK